MFTRFPETSLESWLVREILHRMATQMTKCMTKTLCFIICYEQNTNTATVGPFLFTKQPVCAVYADQMGIRQEAEGKWNKLLGGGGALWFLRNVLVKRKLAFHCPKYTHLYISLAEPVLNLTAKKRYIGLSLFNTPTVETSCCVTNNFNANDCEHVTRVQTVGQANH